MLRTAERKVVYGQNSPEGSEEFPPLPATVLGTIAMFAANVKAAPSVIEAAQYGHEDKPTQVEQPMPVSFRQVQTNHAREAFFANPTDEAAKRRYIEASDRWAAEVKAAENAQAFKAEQERESEPQRFSGTLEPVSEVPDHVPDAWNRQAFEEGTIGNNTPSQSPDYSGEAVTGTITGTHYGEGGQPPEFFEPTEHGVISGYHPDQQ